MEMARRQLFHEVDVMEEWLGMGRPAARRAAPWLAATLSLGHGLPRRAVDGLGAACAEGFRFMSADPSSHFFYLITGIHGAASGSGHLRAGCRAHRPVHAARRLEYRQIAVDCTAWYWHTMGMFWVFLFVLLVFFQ